MKKTAITILCIFLILAGATSAFAIDISGKAPVFSGTDTLSNELAGRLNTELTDVFNIVLNEIQGEIEGIDSKPEKFIQAWGNSAIYASHGGTQRAYIGYKMFAVTLGAMVGVQLPSSPFSIVDDLDGITDKLNNEGDLSLGLNPQIFNASLGINSSFLLKGLYLGARVGYMKLDGLLEGFSYNNVLFGVTANYQLLPTISIAAGFLQWRGLNVGSGIIYQGTNIGYNIGLGTFSEKLNVTGLSDAQLNVNPELALDLTVNTVTIPLEAMTSVKLLHFLNLALGLGADLGFGTSNLKLGVGGDIDVSGPENYGLQQTSAGNLSVSAGGSMAPSLFNVKLMTGLGFSLGPVVIDIPVTYYFANNGFNAGITVGVVW